MCLGIKLTSGGFVTANLDHQIVWIAKCLED
jgi:hypothetical protein